MELYLYSPICLHSVNRGTVLFFFLTFTLTPRSLDSLFFFPKQRRPLICFQAFTSFFTHEVCLEQRVSIQLTHLMLTNTLYQFH